MAFLTGLSKDKEKPAVTPPKPVPEHLRNIAELQARQQAPAKNGRENQDRVLVIGRNIRVKGEVASCETLIVEGLLEAEVQVGTLELNEPGLLKGSADVETAEIAGTFDGTLSVKEKLVVRGTGRVKGDVRYGLLVIEEGGIISGTMTNLEKTGSPKPAANDGDKSKEVPAKESIATAAE